MAKVFFVRHQAAGVMHEFPFADQPSNAQLIAVLKIAEQRHGASHPKTKEAYWARVVDLDLIGDEVPEVAEQSPDTANIAGFGKISAEGRMHVTPKSDGELMTIGAGDIAEVVIGDDGKPALKGK